MTEPADACVNAPGRKGCGRAPSSPPGGGDRGAHRGPVIAAGFVRPHGRAHHHGGDVSKLQVQRTDDQASLEQLARDHYSGAPHLSGGVPGRPHAAPRAHHCDRAPHRPSKMLQPEVLSDPARDSQGIVDIDIEGRRRMIAACVDKAVIRPAPRPGTTGPTRCLRSGRRVLPAPPPQIVSVQGDTHATGFRSNEWHLEVVADI